MAVTVPGCTSITSRITDELHQRVLIVMARRKQRGWHKVLEEALALWAEHHEKALSKTTKRPQ